MVEASQRFQKRRVLSVMNPERRRRTQFASFQFISIHFNSFHSFSFRLIHLADYLHHLVWHSGLGMKNKLEQGLSIPRGEFSMLMLPGQYLKLAKALPSVEQMRTSQPVIEKLYFHVFLSILFTIQQKEYMSYSQNLL